MRGAAATALPRNEASTRSGMSLREGASFGPFENTPRGHSLPAASDAVRAASSRLTAYAPTPVPRRRFEANPGHQAIAGIPPLPAWGQVAAGVIRGSRAVHRDNPVFKFAPEFPEVPRRADGVLEGFDEIVHFVRTGVTCTLCGSLEAAGGPRGPRGASLPIQPSARIPLPDCFARHRSRNAHQTPGKRQLERSAAEAPGVFINCKRLSLAVRDKGRGGPGFQTVGQGECRGA